MAKKAITSSHQEEPSSTTLEEFLVACQKSLARSVRSAQQAAKSDSEFAQGERPVYIIDAIDFELNAGLSLTPHDAKHEAVVVNFDTPFSERSKLRFRVESKPIELLRNAKLELANLDPLGEQLPNARLRAWLIGEDGRTVPGYPVQIYYARAGDKLARQPIEVSTDSVGRVDFSVETLENEIKVVGTRDRFPAYVRGGGRGRVADEFFVWVMCHRRPEWEAGPPPSPQPPVQIKVDDGGQPLQLCSEMIRVRLE